MDTSGLRVRGTGAAPEADMEDMEAGADLQETEDIEADLQETEDTEAGQEEDTEHHSELCALKILEI